MSKHSLILAAGALTVVASCRSDRDRSYDSYDRGTSTSQSAESAAVDRDRTTGRIEPPTSSATEKLSSEDCEFVTKAASAGRFEVESSEVALQKTQNPDTRDFAQRMIDDHSRAKRELESLASRKRISLTQALASEHASTLDRLRGLNAGDFDREYHKVQVDAHREAVDLFERAARDASDSDIRAFARRTVPTLRSHLEHAQGMDSSNIR